MWGEETVRARARKLEFPSKALDLVSPPRLLSFTLAVRRLPVNYEKGLASGPGLTGKPPVGTASEGKRGEYTTSGARGRLWVFLRENVRPKSSTLSLVVYSFLPFPTFHTNP